jgi:hypothetical protein
MQTSEQINEIAAALAKAQGKMENPDKDNVNPHFKSRYADLASGINAVRQCLSEQGISVVQTTCLDGELMVLNTRLCHASGQWIEGMYPICKFPTPPQQIGAAMTYARRYSMFAIVGIAPEDDDGNSVSKEDVPPRQTKTVERKSAPPIDDFPGDAPSKMPAQEYVEHAIAAINNWTGNAVALKQWWDDEKPYREADGVVNPSPEFEKLFEAFKHRGLSLAGKVAPKRAA